MMRADTGTIAGIVWSRLEAVLFGAFLLPGGVEFMARSADGSQTSGLGHEGGTKDSDCNALR